MDKDTLSEQNKVAGISPTEGATASDDISSQRRKLIRASAAAIPAVLTLRSGAAAAAMASMDCRDKDALKAGTADLVLGDQSSEPALDEWVRVPAATGKKVSVYNTNDKKNEIFYCVELNTTTTSFLYYREKDFKEITATSKIDQINAVTGVTCYYVNNKNLTVGAGWQCTDINMVSVAIPSSDLTGELDSSNNNLKIVQLLAYVGWDSNGVAGISYYPKPSTAGEDPNAAAVTTSCLCSVDPTFNMQV